MDLKSLDPPIEIETGSSPTASVIWLHGLGADGHDFENLVPELHLPKKLAVRFIFPHAPQRPVTINGGYVMRAWYDIAMTDQGFFQSAAHILESQEILQAFIDAEIGRGIASERIVLAGFSQGGAIAVHAGLRCPKRLAGILSLSAPIPFIDTLLQEINPANATTPIFMAQGTDDRMISLASAQTAREKMTARGLLLEWHEYAMGHTVMTEEIQDIARWFSRVYSSA